LSSVVLDSSMNTKYCVAEGMEIVFFEKHKIGHEIGIVAIHRTILRKAAHAVRGVAGAFVNARVAGERPSRLFLISSILVLSAG